MSKKYLKQNYKFHEEDYNDLINDILETHINSIIEILQSEMYNVRNINAGNNLIIKKILDNKILIYPNNKDIVKLDSIYLHKKYRLMIGAHLNKEIQIYGKVLISIDNNGLSKYIGDNIFNIRVSLSLSNFSLKVSLLKNSFCFDKFPKINITKIKVDGDDKRISKIIGNTINILLNERASQKISNIITDELKRKLKSI